MRQTFIRLRCDIILSMKAEQRTDPHSSLVKRHFEYEYQNYNRFIKKVVPKYESLHRYVIKQCFLPLGEPTSILDLGVGTGKTALALLENYSRSTLTGIDLTPGMISLAKKRLKPYTKRLKFITADMKNFVPKEKYDLCVAVLSIHHLNQAEKQKLFSRIFSCLNEGGLFVIGDRVTQGTESDTKHQEKIWKKILCEKLGEKNGNQWFEKFQKEDLPDNVIDQKKWLEAVGFKDVKVHWEYLIYAVFSAKKI